MNSPGWRKTHIRGRITKSLDGAVYFDNGQRLDPVNSGDGIRRSFVSDAYVGDYGFCDNAEPYNCFAHHNGKTVKIPVDPPLASTLDRSSREGEPVRQAQRASPANE